MTGSLNPIENLGRNPMMRVHGFIDKPHLLNPKVSLLLCALYLTFISNLDKIGLQTRVKTWQRITSLNGQKRN
jgi:hypothetical protein